MQNPRARWDDCDPAGCREDGNLAAVASNAVESVIVELAIVGAGPAGLAAAEEAVACGLQPIVVDAFARPGGQYFRQPPSVGARPTAGGAGRVPERPDGKRQRNEGQQLVHRLAALEVTTCFGTEVWGVFPSGAEDGPGYLLCLYGPEGSPRRIRAAKVILAPGAYDRPVPFPGWTLPGVMTAGAAQVLLKGQHVLPGRRVLLSGTGPLQWILAQELLAGGAEVAAVLDANPFPLASWRQAAAACGIPFCGTQYKRAFWGQGERLREGLNAWQAIRRAGVPVYWGQAVHHAEGDGQVERAVVASPIGEHKQTMAVDTICLGYGFVPAAQLSLQAGCEHVYREALGGPLPVRDDRLQTTLPGLFVAGDGAGIGGKDVALWEGRLAALAAAQQLGRPTTTARFEVVGRALARERRFAALLNRLFPFPDHLWDRLTDDTIVCRCELVTAGELRQVVRDGAATPSAAKALTRAGMGYCQGRMCGGPVAHLATQETGSPLGGFTPRPPVVPVPLEGLVPKA